MRTQLCLVVLALTGIALLVVPNTHFQFPADGLSQHPMDIWLGTVKYFGIPLAMLLMGFTRSLLAKISVFLWGIWVTLISLATLVRVKEVAPSITLFGVLLIVGVLIFGLALTLFSIIKLSLQGVNNKAIPTSAQVSLLRTNGDNKISETSENNRRVVK